MTDPAKPKKRIGSWVSFAAAVLVPLALLAVMGVVSFVQGRQEAELRAQRVVQALSEHALRTFRAHDLIINAVDRYLVGRDWAEIDSSRPLHEFFKGLIKDSDDINTIFVVGPTGREGNSSLVFPLAPTDLTGRAFYEALRLDGGLHISDPDVGRINKQRFFSFTRRRSHDGGLFDGVISVSVNPAYFENFYKSMVETASDSVSLVRSDGLLLVRIPTPPGEGKQMLPATPGGLMAAIQHNPEAGTFSQGGSLDGVRRIYSYRRVGDYPLYATYGLSYAAVWATWQRGMVAYTFVCLMAAGVLTAAAMVVRRHNRREAEVTSEYAQETARRLAAEETNRSKDEFLATLGHELRNPLASISAGVEILRRTLVPDAKGAQALSIIGRQIDHLQRLLGDLLDVARSVYGKMHLDLQVISVLAAASNVAANYQGAIRQEVKVTVGGSPAWVRADGTRLRQMIENLVDNAHKYGARNIALHVTEGDQWVELTVADDGNGISAELLPTLFDPFVQGKQPPDRAQGGLGLGLALVQRLAAAHGGTLHVNSPGPGQGSAFTIRLPKASAPEPKDLLARAPEVRTVASVRVLVIEDQPDARDTLRMLLEIDNHDVATAANGRDGIAKFESFLPQLVLIDIGLPEMDGYDVARAIRAQPNGKHAYLVALTGYGQPDDLRRAQEAGFDLHLTKPVSYQNLAKLLMRN